MYLNVCVCVLVVQSSLTLCSLKYCSLPGSLDHGILQARILEWVAIPFPGIKPRSPPFQADSLPSEHPGSPYLPIFEYMYIWITLPYTWNIINQLYFSKKHIPYATSFTSLSQLPQLEVLSYCKDNFSLHATLPSFTTNFNSCKFFLSNWVANHTQMQPACLLKSLHSFRYCKSSKIFT